MFFGTTPSIISQFLIGEIERHNPARVFIPFAGNFVVEQLAGKACPGSEVHSTDISLYSRAIGYGLSNLPSDITYKPEAFELFPELKQYQSPEQMAAAVIFLTEAAKAHSRGEKIQYYKQAFRDAQKNILHYLGKISRQITAVKSNLPKKFFFYGTDGYELCQNVRKGDLVFYDPPVLLGDYEKMFKDVEALFDFITPDYTEMTDAVKLENLAYFQDIGAICYYRTNKPVNLKEMAYQEVFRYQYRYDGLYCINSNVPGKSFVGMWSPLRDEIGKHYKIISKSDVISDDSEIRLVPCHTNISNHYRLLWVKKALMTSGGYPYLVFIDNKLAGVIVLESGLKFNTTLCMILSDPAAPTSRYKRLSKLILYLICSQDMLEIINERTLWPHDGFTTIVLTNNSTSMKYRGLFDLAHREENKVGHNRYRLTYQNRNNLFPTFKDALTEWLKKDASYLVTNLTHKKE